MVQYGSAVTNPSLIAELEGNPQSSAAPKNSTPQYGAPVTDPDTLRQLNSSRMAPDERLNALWNKLDERLAEHDQPTSIGDDFQKLLGYGTMIAAPEVKMASLLPSGIRALLPEATGGLKFLRDIVGSTGKTAAAAYGGTKLLPGTDEDQAENNAVLGGSVAALATPLGMMLRSTNPFTRYLTGGALGAAGGYGASQLTGHPAIASTLGAGLGAFLGGRFVAPAEMAALNAQNAMLPINASNAATRVPAAAAENIPLNMAEATGSPIHKQMLNKAAMSDQGSNVLYPWAVNREDLEKNAYQNLLNKVSPSASTIPEEKAFKNAFALADQKGTRVNTQPVIDYINSLLPKYETGSKISSALNMAKNRLAMTPETSAKYAALFAPVNKVESNIQKTVDNLHSQISQMEANAPNSYFRASTGYDTKIKSLKDELDQNQKALQQISQHKENFMKQNNIGNYENTVEGLHNAKMGIQGIIEGQGENAIGNTAAGKLKQVNKRLTAQIKESSPEYAVATRMSNMRQARGEIEKSMATTDLSGASFYDRVLKNDIEYKKLYDRLADPENPKVPTAAQQSLHNLKTAMPDLMNNLSVASGKAMAKEHPENSFKLLDLVKTFTNKVFMNRYNKAVAELMTNPRWQTELQNVADMKAGEERGISLGRLISKVSVATNAAAMSKQGSEANGSQFR